jgi:hypothetical protein
MVLPTRLADEVGHHPARDVERDPVDRDPVAPKRVVRPSTEIAALVVRVTVPDRRPRVVGHGSILHLRSGS